MADPLECSFGAVRAGEPVVVAVRGEIDLATAGDLESCVHRAFDGGPGSVILDFADLTFIDSSGLRVLLALSQEATTRGIAFALRKVPGNAERVLELTGLTEVFARDEG